MRWNTPLSEAHAALLLERLAPQPGDRLLDLGCGWGELLLRALEAADDTSGTGVDTDPVALERGRRSAATKGLEARVAFVEGAARRWAEPADRVLCVGASHALGGTQPMLEALTDLVRPGGRLLVGDGCWPTDARPPGRGAEDDWSDVLPLTEVLHAATAAGWRVLHQSTADQREWDDFESTWRVGREEWLLAHPDDPEASAVRAELDALLTDYVTGHRGVLGFCYLVLGRPSR